MKISIARRAATFALIGATALLMAACSSVKLDDTDGANGGGSGKFGSQPWNDPSSPLFEKSVYFGFDEYTVQTKYQKMLSAHASYLKSNPKQKIIIQGNTDERGTAEYNLALGQRRAEAAKALLISSGVNAKRITASSLGSTHPVSVGSTEESWAKNRVSISILTNTSGDAVEAPAGEQTPIAVIKKGEIVPTL